MLVADKQSSLWDKDGFGMKNRNMRAPANGLCSHDSFAGAGKSISTPQELFRSSGKEGKKKKTFSFFLHLNEMIEEHICNVCMW